MVGLFIVHWVGSKLYPQLPVEHCRNNGGELCEGSMLLAIRHRLGREKFVRVLMLDLSFPSTTEKAAI
jgi:hypothetical protein